MLKEKENSEGQLNFNETQMTGEQINFNDYILTFIYSLLVSFANYTKRVYEGAIQQMDKEMLVSVWKRFIESILLEGPFEKISKKEVSSSETFPFLDYSVTERLNVIMPGKVRSELDARYKSLFFMANEYSDRGIFLGLYENDILYNYVVVVPSDVLEGINVYTLSTRKALRLKSKGVESLYYDYEQEDERKYFADIEFNENLRSNANISSNFIDMVNAYAGSDNYSPSRAISLQDIYNTLSSIFSDTAEGGGFSGLTLTLGFEEEFQEASIIRVKVKVDRLVDLTSRVFHNYVRSVFKDFLDLLRSGYAVQDESKVNIEQGNEIQINIKQEIESYFKLLYFRDFQNVQADYDASQDIGHHLLNIVSYAINVDVRDLVASAKGPHVLFDIYTELFIRKARMAYDVYAKNPEGKDAPMYVIFIDEFFTQLNEKNMSIVLKLWDGLMNRSEKFPPNLQFILAGNAPSSDFIKFLDPDSKVAVERGSTVSRDTVDAFLNRVSFYILLPHFDYVTSSFTKEALSIYYLDQMSAIGQNPVVKPGAGMDSTYEEVIKNMDFLLYVQRYMDSKFTDNANLLELIKNVRGGKIIDVDKIKDWALSLDLVKDAYIEILSGLAELRENVTILAYYKVWTLIIPIFLHSAFAAVFDVLYRTIEEIPKKVSDQFKQNTVNELNHLKDFIDSLASIDSTRSAEGVSVLNMQNQRIIELVYFVAAVFYAFNLLEAYDQVYSKLGLDKKPLHEILGFSDLTMIPRNETQNNVTIGKKRLGDFSLPGKEDYKNILVFTKELYKHRSQSVILNVYLHEDQGLFFDISMPDEIRGPIEFLHLMFVSLAYYIANSVGMGNDLAEGIWNFLLEVYRSYKRLNVRDINTSFAYLLLGYRVYYNNLVDLLETLELIRLYVTAVGADRKYASVDIEREIKVLFKIDELSGKEKFVQSVILDIYRRLFGFVVYGSNMQKVDQDLKNVKLERWRDNNKSTDSVSVLRLFGKEFLLKSLNNKQDSVLALTNLLGLTDSKQTLDFMYQIARSILKKEGIKYNLYNFLVEEPLKKFLQASKQQNNVQNDFMNILSARREYHYLSYIPFVKQDKKAEVDFSTVLESIEDLINNIQNRSGSWVDRLIEKINQIIQNFSYSEVKSWLKVYRSAATTADFLPPKHEIETMIRQVSQVASKNEVAKHYISKLNTKLYSYDKLLQFVSSLTKSEMSEQTFNLMSEDNAKLIEWLKTFMQDAGLRFYSLTEEFRPEQELQLEGDENETERMKIEKGLTYIRIFLATLMMYNDISKANNDVEKKNIIKNYIMRIINQEKDSVLLQGLITGSAVDSVGDDIANAILQLKTKSFVEHIFKRFLYDDIILDQGLTILGYIDIVRVLLKIYQSEIKGKIESQEDLNRILDLIKKALIMIFNNVYYYSAFERRVAELSGARADLLMYLLLFLDPSREDITQVEYAASGSLAGARGGAQVLSQYFQFLRLNDKSLIEVEKVQVRETAQEKEVATLKVAWIYYPTSFYFDKDEDGLKVNIVVNKLPVCITGDSRNLSSKRADADIDSLESYSVDEPAFIYKVKTNNPLSINLPANATPANTFYYIKNATEELSLMYLVNWKTFARSHEETNKLMVLIGLHTLLEYFKKFIDIYDKAQDKNGEVLSSMKENKDIHPLLVGILMYMYKKISETKEANDYKELINGIVTEIIQEQNPFYKNYDKLDSFVDGEEDSSGQKSYSRQRILIRDFDTSFYHKGQKRYFAEAEEEITTQKAVVKIASYLIAPLSMYFDVLFVKDVAINKT